MSKRRIPKSLFIREKKHYFDKKDFPSTELVIDKNENDDIYTRNENSNKKYICVDENCKKDIPNKYIEYNEKGEFIGYECPICESTIRFN